MTIQIKWIIVILVLISSLIGAVGALFLKKGSKDFNIGFSVKFILELLRNYTLIIGISLYALATVFFLMALRLGELSVVYPLTSMSYIFISILSVYFLKERMNGYKWIGIFLIIAGVILVKM